MTTQQQFLERYGLPDEPWSRQSVAILEDVVPALTRDAIRMVVLSGMPAVDAAAVLRGADRPPVDALIKIWSRAKLQDIAGRFAARREVKPQSLVDVVLACALRRVVLRGSRVHV